MQTVNKKKFVFLPNQTICLLISLLLSTGGGRIKRILDCSKTLYCTFLVILLYRILVLALPSEGQRQERPFSGRQGCLQHTKGWCFCLLVFHMWGGKRAECSSGSWQPQRIQIIIVINIIIYHKKHASACY